MAISGISGGGESTPAVSDAAITKKTGDHQLGKDDFMKLLVAQLKNQDPNNPVDTKEMVTQLSQLTSVEQLTQMSSKLDTLTAATNSSAANSSSALIGKTVKGVADTVTLQASGSAQGAVNLAQNAKTMSISVINSAGRVVKTINQDNVAAGNQPIKWDGTTDSGERAQSGMYTFQVSAKDSQGVAIDTDQSVSGIVTGVYYENGAPELEVGGTRVPLSNLTSISQ
jgi:flagellar basal-body rod modification protein FlgD